MTAADIAAGLIAEHLADLRKSGLSDDTIAAMQVRSLSAADLAKAPGYGREVSA